jgi:hypothetical protein
MLFPLSIIDFAPEALTPVSGALFCNNGMTRRPSIDVGPLGRDI